MKKTGLILLLLFFFWIKPVSAQAQPVLDFSDIISGPKVGNTDGSGGLTSSEHGAIVTIWGNNLRSPQGDSKVYFKDYLGNSYEAAHVYYWVNADGKSGGGPADLYKYHKMQEIAFSIPSTVADGPGRIYVEVAGENSNELDFTVRTGKIYFVDNIAYNASAQGTFSDPFSPKKYYEAMRAGDIGYFKENLYNGSWGYGSCASNFGLVGESQGGHSGTDEQPIAFVGYPGANAVFDANSGIVPYQNFKWYSYTGNTDDAGWMTIAKLKLKAYKTSILGATGWRVVGNDCEGLTITTQVQSGIILSMGKTMKILGNIMHGGRTGDKLDHALYISGCPENGTETGWNYFYDNNFGRGPIISVNCYANRCPAGVYSGDNYIHGNVVDTTTYPSRAVYTFSMGYNEGEAVEPTAYVYNNIFIDGGLIEGTIQSPVLCHSNSHAYIYNNLFYNANVSAIDVYAYESASTNPTLSVTIKNNIFYMKPDAFRYLNIHYTYTGPRDISNNLYYGIGNYTGNEDSNSINGDPLFINPASGDFNLRELSPAIDTGSSLVSAIVSKDFLGYDRPIDGDNNGVALYDIGAFEYSPDDYSGNAMADINGDGKVNVQDVQLCVNIILGIDTHEEFVNKLKVLTVPEDECTVSDLQAVVNAILRT